MGGTFPNSSQCDVPAQFGFHSLDLGKQNPSDAMWYEFRSNITTYQVPTEIISVVGGAPTGGATVKAPQAGFDQPDLSVYFGRTYHPLSRSPTRVIPATGMATSSASSKPVPLGAIIGGSVGGGVFLLAVLGFGVGLCCVIRKRRTSANPRANQGAQEMEQKPVYPQHPGFMTPIAQLPGGEPGHAVAVELSSPEGEAAAAKLARYSGSTAVPTSPRSISPRSSPIVPPLPVYTSTNAYPGYQPQPFGRGSPPAQWPQPIPVPQGYSPMAEYFPPPGRSPSSQVDGSHSEIQFDGRREA